MGDKTVTTKPRRLRIAMIGIAMMLLAAMVLPLTGYVVHGAGQAWAADEKAETSESEAKNPRAEYWRAVRQGVEGYTAVQGQETAVLIQNGGENWRSIRNGPVSFLGASAILAVFAILILSHLIIGKSKLDTRTGQTIPRWTAFERANHWIVAGLFIILAVTGLSLLFGRTVLIPVLGKEGFAAWAGIGKTLHDYLSIPFMVTLVLMLVPWIPRHMFRTHDLVWLKSLGGMLSKGHPPAGFVNAGEKVWFWLLFFGSIGMTASGFYLLFPNLGWERDAMQLANVVHSSTAMLLIAVSLGHMYVGSLGTEGALEGMVSGEVDEGWAQQHHSEWYARVKDGTSAAEPERTAPGAAGAVQT